MKNLIISILKSGRNSPDLKKFIRICLNLSISAINTSKYRDYVLTKTSLSVEDIAYDSIGDLFKQTDGMYLYFNNYFEDVIDNISELHEDVLKSKLSAIIISRTKQRITEIREEYGEIYFRIKRAIHLHMRRHGGIFKRIIYNEDLYIYTCPQKEINFKKESFPDLVLIDILNSENHKSYSVTKIVNFLFEQIKTEKEFNKAIVDTTLFNVISSFYKSRMSEFLSDQENVHYYINEED